MASEDYGVVLQGIERIFNQGSLTGLSEGQLLRQFATGDEGRFVFERVMPGEATISRAIPIKELATSQTWGYSHTVGVEVVPPMPGDRSDEPLDLGAIAVTAVKQPESAPAARKP
jgi:hypothetical protein